MLISDKQHEANLRNAQHSTGPKTEEGKAAVACNAITYGLRTRATILPHEDTADYVHLCNEFEMDWNPQHRTEWCYVETMITSQWLLARLARTESRLQEKFAFNEAQMRMLAQVYKQRAQLERAFRNAVADMRQARKDRHEREAREARQERETRQAAKAAESAKPAPQPATHPPSPPAPYVMSEPAASHPLSCAPTGADSR